MSIARPLSTRLDMHPNMPGRNHAKLIDALRSHNIIARCLKAMHRLRIPLGIKLLGIPIRANFERRSPITKVPGFMPLT